MKKKLLPLIITILILTATPINAAAQTASNGMSFLSEYVQTIYDEDSSIPISLVKSVIQDNNGYMWYAGYHGLTRYDGINAKLFTTDDGFPSYSVNILFEDSSKRLWAGTNDNGIVLYDGNKFMVYGIAEGLPSASVRDITEDENGSVFVATTNGITIIKSDGTLEVHPVLNNVFATHIEYIGDGRFLCLLNNGKIVLFNQKEVLKEYESDYFGNTQPFSLFLSEGGKFYIGTVADTVYIVDNDFSRYTSLTIPILQSLNSFYEDSNGRIWISADNGLGYLTDGAFVPVDGLMMNNSIECVYEDYEGNFWVGSSRQGLLQLTRSKFTDIGFLAGLQDYNVNSTAVWNNDLYIGADDGLIILRGNTPIENDLTEMLRGIRIRCILADSKERLWICAYESYGLVLVKPNGSVAVINDESGLISNKVRFITEAENGNMLVGMVGGISIIQDEEIIRNYTKDDGLINDFILSLSDDTDGIIYAGTDGGGIYAIDGSTVKNYTEKDGLAAGIVLRTVVIENRLWVTTGNAICYLDETGIHKVDKLAAYDKNVYDIKQIGGDIWFLHSNGINICNIQNLLSDEELIIKQILKRDGLSSPVTSNSWNTLDKNGIMYISTGKGVLAIDTLNMYKSETIPQAAIVEILTDGKEADIGGEISVSGHVQRIDIHIALLSFASTDGAVSYMLEGFDSEPITVSRTELSWISYTNLKGGKYTFYLYGTNAAGIQSETVMLTINKDFTFFEMPFVRLIIVFLSIGVLMSCAGVFISVRTKTALKQKQEYKEITGQIMKVAAVMTDSKSAYTSGHSLRVAEYSKLVGKRLGMSDNELETLYYAAILHDIGNTAISDSILNKNGKLTNEEYDIVKTHVTIGSEMLREVSVIKDLELGARYHHERIDGKGYVEGLSGDKIPLTAKIISVCNAFDCMMSDRPHRKAMSVEKAQSELIQGAGTQFDEKVAAVLILLINEGSVPL